MSPDMLEARILSTLKHFHVSDVGLMTLSYVYETTSQPPLEFAKFCELAQAEDFDTLDKFLLDNKPEFYGRKFFY